MWAIPIFRYRRVLQPVLTVLPVLAGVSELVWIAVERCWMSRAWPALPAFSISAEPLSLPGWLLRPEYAIAGPYISYTVNEYR